MIGDFLVDAENPLSLDQTLHEIGAVLLGGPDAYVRYEGHYVVRPVSGVGFVRWAVERQGYASVVGVAPIPAPWDLDCVPRCADRLSTGLTGVDKDSIL